LYIILRALKIISRKTFAQRVNKQLRDFLADDEERRKTVDFLLSKIDKDVLKQLQSNCDENTVTVILSASPEEYVRDFAKSLGYTGIGSRWKGGSFFYCYGENKIKLLSENYPSSEYEYNFAVSDSSDDIELLNLFRTAALVKNGKMFPLRKSKPAFWNSDMRVCMLTTSYPRWSSDTSGFYVRELAQTLAGEYNIEVTVLAPADAGSVLRERSGKADVRRIRYFWPSKLQKLAYGNGIPCNIQTGTVAKLNVPFFLFAFSVYACIFARKADIIHAHWGVPGALAIVTRFIHRRPVVVMIHGTDLSSSNKLVTSISKWAIKRADAVITNSPENHHISSFLRADKGNSFYIHNGMEYPSDEKLAELRGRRKKTEGIVNIISVARLIPERKYDFLIRAFEKLKRRYPQVFLTIIGDGPAEDSLKSLTAELGLEHHINFMGRVPHDDIFKYLVEADLYISPTTVETHGIAVAEAAACGLPIVTTRVGYPAELVIDGQTGFVVEPGKEEALLGAMQKMLADSNFLRRAGQNMQKRIQELNLTWSEWAKKILEVYKICLKAK
jgi:glycosyltransferase involved in cell wall biosynthesis